MKKLVEFINDNVIDSFEFPYGEIASMGNEDHWNRLSERYGTKAIVDAARQNDYNPNDRYFQFFDEPKVRLVSYNNVYRIIDLIGEDRLNEECEAQDTIMTVVYGQTDIWKSRNAAIDFFLHGMLACEGSERDRYTEIYHQLRSGKWFVMD